MDGRAIHAHVSQNQWGRNETKRQEEQPEIPVSQQAPSEEAERRDNKDRNQEHPRRLAHVRKAAPEAGPHPLPVILQALHHEIPGGDDTQKQQRFDCDVRSPIEKGHVEGHQHGRHVRRRLEATVERINK